MLEPAARQIVGDPTCCLRVMGGAREFPSLSTTTLGLNCQRMTRPMILTLYRILYSKLQYTFSSFTHDKCLKLWWKYLKLNVFSWFFSEGVLLFLTSTQQFNQTRVSSRRWHHLSQRLHHRYQRWHHPYNDFWWNSLILSLSLSSYRHLCFRIWHSSTLHSQFTHFTKKRSQNFQCQFYNFFHFMMSN